MNVKFHESYLNLTLGFHLSTLLPYPCMEHMPIDLVDYLDKYSCPSRKKLRRMTPSPPLFFMLILFGSLQHALALP